MLKQANQAGHPVFFVAKNRPINVIITDSSRKKAFNIYAVIPSLRGIFNPVL